MNSGFKNGRKLLRFTKLARTATDSLAGLTISAKFRRNFGKKFVFASYRDPKFRYFSVFFVFKFKIQQISTEIRRNLPKFRNGIPFPLNTGIWPENEKVNPVWKSSPQPREGTVKRKRKWEWVLTVDSSIVSS